jgi:hypothetical protein
MRVCLRARVAAGMGSLALRSIMLGVNRDGNLGGRYVRIHNRRRWTRALLVSRGVSLASLSRVVDARSGEDGNGVSVTRRRRRQRSCLDQDVE